MDEKNRRKIFELIEQREKLLLEIVDILVEERVEIGPVLRHDPEKHRPIARVSEIKHTTKDGLEVTLERFEEKGKRLPKKEPEERKPCTICSGARIKGRHNKGCPRGLGEEKVVREPSGSENASEEATEGHAKREEQAERPLSGYSADWRSKCCNGRIIQEGSGEGTNYYVCLECKSACDPKMPDIKSFSCEECTHAFEADTSETIRCPECGSSSVWPV